MIDKNPGDPTTKINNAMQSAKKNGKLNLSNAGLSEFPAQLYNFNDVTPDGENWWEDTPLTLLDMSHNKIT